MEDFGGQLCFDCGSTISFWEGTNRLHILMQRKREEPTYRARSVGLRRPETGNAPHLPIVPSHAAVAIRIDGLDRRAFGTRRPPSIRPALATACKRGSPELCGSVERQRSG